MLKIKRTINVSLSDIPIVDKEVSDALMPSRDEEEIIRKNKIKKKYGIHHKKSIRFAELCLDIPQLCQALINGYAFASCFNIDKWNISLDKDGKPKKTDKGKLIFTPLTDKIMIGGFHTESFSIKQKTEAKFRESYVIAIDIDDSLYPPEDIINNLSNKPNFWYTTYSNERDGKGYRFRLIYVFFLPIEDYYYYRFCGYGIACRIQNEVGSMIGSIDPCSTVAAQTFYGTNIKGLDYYGNKTIPVVNQRYELIYPDSFYTIDDFKELTLQNYIQFLKDDCYYKSLEEGRRIKFQTRADLLEKAYSSGCLDKEELRNIEEQTKVKDTDKLNDTLYEEIAITLGATEDLLKRFLLCKNKQEWDALREVYLQRYSMTKQKKRYISSQDWEIDENGNEYMLMPKDFFEQKYYYTMVKETVKDEATGKEEIKKVRKAYVFKNSRQQVLFNYIHQTRLLNLDANYDTMLVWCADFLFNNIKEGKVYPRHLIRKLNKAMQSDTPWIQDRGMIERWHNEYLKEHPNQLHIFKNNHINELRHAVATKRETVTLSLMNPWLSAKENKRILEENGIKLSISEINEQLKPIRDSLTKEWQSKIDITKSPKQNYSILHSTYPELTLNVIEHFIKQERRKI